MNLEKIGESQFRGFYKKDYKSDKKIGVGSIVNTLIDKNYVIDAVKVMENSDVGEKRYQGEYPVNVFLKLYEEMDRSDVSSYGIFLNDENIYSIVIAKDSDVLTSYMKNPEMELDTILNNNMKLN